MGDIFLFIMVIIFALSIIGAIIEALEKFIKFLKPPLKDDTVSNSNRYIPKEKENKSAFIRHEATKKTVISDFNMTVYEKLKNTLELLFDESLYEGEAYFDEFMDIIDSIIEDELGETKELKDYILFHDPWKQRDRLFTNTYRKTIVFFHRKLMDKVNFEQVSFIQMAEDLIYDSLDDQTIKEAEEKKWISSMIEKHPLGYTEFGVIQTSEFQLDDAVKIKEKKLNVSNQYYKGADFYKENIENHILENIDDYVALVVDDYYYSDTYVLIPINKKISMEEINTNIKLIYDTDTNLFIGMKYKDKFYPRLDIWMSFNDRDLPEYNVYSIEELVIESFLTGEDLENLKLIFNSPRKINSYRKSDISKTTDNEESVSKKTTDEKIVNKDNIKILELKESLKELKQDLAQGKIDKKEYERLKQDLYERVIRSI